MKSVERVLSKRYARAAASLLKTEDMPAFIDDMFALSKVFESADFFNNPSVPKKNKKAALGEINNSLLKGLAFVMIDNKRLKLFSAAAAELKNIYYRRTETLEAEIFSASELNKEQSAAVERMLKTLFKKTAVAASYKKDKTLIGGLKINADGVCIDGSVSNNLEKLKSVLEV